MGALMEVYGAARPDVEARLFQSADLRAGQEVLTEALNAVMSEAVRRETDPRLRSAISGMLAGATGGLMALSAVSAPIQRPARMLRALPLLPALAAAWAAVQLFRVDHYMDALLCLLAGAVCAAIALTQNPAAHAPKPLLLAREAMRALDRTVREMDEAIERQSDQLAMGPAESPELTGSMLTACQMLLEARATGDGTYALRAVPQVLNALSEEGIDAEDMTTHNRELFEVFPTLGEPITIRPALTQNGRLIARGQATERL